MAGVIAYVVLVILTGGQRLSELAISTRNARSSFARGGVEYGRRHFPWMVALHTGFLAACIAEAVTARRPFRPALGWSALAVALLCQAGRFWIIGSLRRQWNTRVIVVPGEERMRTGPYRLGAHPNYAIVALEGAALPLVRGNWITALAFTVLNGVLLLGFRLPTENRALKELAG